MVEFYDDYVKTLYDDNEIHAAMGIRDALKEIGNLGSREMLNRYNWDGKCAYYECTVGRGGTPVWLLLVVLPKTHKQRIFIGRVDHDIDIREVKGSDVPYSFNSLDGDIQEAILDSIATLPNDIMLAVKIKMYGNVKF